MSQPDLQWVEKYRPETLSEIQGNNTDIKAIKSWAKSWSRGDTPLLLIGDAGVGKTATVQALANDMDWKINDINASSQRSKEDIAELVAEMQVGTLDGGQQLIFLDEVDSFSKKKSSLAPFVEELSSPNSPTILAANKEWEIPYSIKNQCKTFEFSLGKQSVKAKLRDIMDAEGITLSNKELGQLATRGNLRAAINDLQRYKQTGEIGWDDRQTEADNFDVMDNFLRGKRYSGDMSPPSLVVWLEENLANDFRGIEAGVSYDALSRADKWLGRAQSTQNYSFWRYAGRIADQTAELRLTEPYGGYIQKNYPQHFRKKKPKAKDSTPEAKLFRKLKGFDTGEFGFGGNYTYFRHVVLPQIGDFPEAARLRMAVELGLQSGDDELKALDISNSKYDSFLSEEIEDTQAQLDSW